MYTFDKEGTTWLVVPAEEENSASKCGFHLLVKRLETLGDFNFLNGLHLGSCSFAHQIMAHSSTSTSWQRVSRCQYFPEQQQGISACLSWPSAFELLSKVAPGNFICGTLILATAELLLLSVEAETSAPPKVHWSCCQIMGLVLLSDKLLWFVPYRH